MKSKTKIIFILILFVCGLLLLGWRVFYLQHNCHQRYTLQTGIGQQTVVTQHPQRGTIMDCRGRILAASNELETVFVEPAAIAQTDAVKEIAMELQEILDIPGHKICGMILDSANPGFVKIKTEITPQQREAILKAKLSAVGIQSNWQRYYPAGPLLSHVVGFVGIDQKGLAGIEQRYESQLTGTVGRGVMAVDAGRRPIGMRHQDIVVDGMGLILTIDSSIQQFTRSALLKQYSDYQAASATAIVIQPKTGEVLAMVSLPDFEPGRLSSANKKTLGNRAITDPFEPGSIFKPIVAALAIDAGAISVDEKFYCEKGNYHGKGFGVIGEWANHQFGDMTVHQILTESSNIGMAKIGQRMKRKKLYEGVKLFGFGSKTGIDLPGEDSGVVRDLKKWDGYSITRVPYGHEINVTAIQIVQAYCILANGGRFITPHIVKAIVEADGNIRQLKRPPPLAAQVIKPQTANWIVTKALSDVVKEGTGKLAATEKWEAFGKTGTANIANEGYDEKNYVASFAGGAPADDPQVVILVSIRKPKRSLGKGYSGGRVAAPVFREILEKTLNYLEPAQKPF
jgi:cell division protein FtsI/penicillin-binding protein 2